MSSLEEELVSSHDAAARHAADAGAKGGALSQLEAVVAAHSAAARASARELEAKAELLAAAQAAKDETARWAAHRAVATAGGVTDSCDDMELASGNVAVVSHVVLVVVGKAMCHRPVFNVLPLRC